MKFTVVQSNPSNEGKTFVTKLQTKRAVDLGPLGTKGVTRHYYISTTKQPAKDTVIELDLDQFNIVEHPFEAVTDDGEVVEMQLKWLHLK